MKRLSLLVCCLCTCLSIACGPEEENNNNKVVDPPNNMTQNQPPVAEAGENQLAKVGERIEVNASQSSDPEGAIITTTWTMQGPAGSNASLERVNAFRSSFVPDIEGIYTLTLTVSDGELETIDRVSVKVEGEVAVNATPVARIMAPAMVVLGDTFALSGTNSSDDDANDTLTYRWSITAPDPASEAFITNVTGADTMFTPDVLGDHIFELVVNDGTIDSMVATATVTVLAEPPVNMPPAANAGEDQPNVFMDTLVTLDGSASLDPEGLELTYAWSITSAPTDSSATLSDSTAVNPTFTPNVEGSYILQLVVNDGEFDSPPDFILINVFDGTNDPPNANAGGNRAGRINTTVSLDGGSSNDPEGAPIASYQWTLISQPAGSVVTLQDANMVVASLELDVLGTYELELVVNDGIQDSTPDRITVVATDGSVPCIIISEYIEDGNNKAIELYNCGPNPAALNEVGVCLVNGNATGCGANALLSGSLAPGAVFTMCRDGLDLTPNATPSCDYSDSSVMSFNGDDRLAVFQDTDLSGDYSGADEILDAFGTLATKPVGKPWEDTIYRRCDFAPYLGVGPFDPTGSFQADPNTADFSQFGISPALNCVVPNRAPIARISAPLAAETTTQVTVDALQSTDPDADPMTYTWALTAKPAASVAVLSDTTGDTITFTPDLDGTYTLTLVANDQVLDSAIATFDIQARPPVQSGNTCLIISEVIEGTSSSRAVELYNCGLADLDLSNYVICVVSNGSSSCGGVQALSGTLAVGETYGLCSSQVNSSAFVDAGDCDRVSPITSFNGNDRLVLYKDENTNGAVDTTDTIVDAFGETANEPSNDPWADKAFSRCEVTPYDGLTTFTVNTFYTEIAMSNDPNRYGDIFANFGDAPTLGGCP